MQLSFFFLCDILVIYLVGDQCVGNTEKVKVSYAVKLDKNHAILSYICYLCGMV